MGIGRCFVQVRRGTELPKQPERSYGYRFLTGAALIRTRRLRLPLRRVPLPFQGWGTNPKPRAYPRNFSIFALIASAGCTPISISLASPSLKKMIVGYARTPCRCFASR